MFQNSPLCVGVCILLVTFTFLAWRKFRCSYWQQHTCIQAVPALPLLGNLKELLLLRVSFGELFQLLYATPGLQLAPVVGIHVLHTPALLIREPELIRAVLIKEFHMFLNRYEAADMQHDALGALTLPLAKHKIWRECRKKLAEFFTSGRLKHTIYPRMWEVADELAAYIERAHRKLPTHEGDRLQKRAVVIEVKEMCALYTTDLTALIAFSMRADSLKHGASRLRQQCQQLLAPSCVKALHFLAIFFLPKLNGLLRAKVFTREYANFMRQLVQQVSATRARARGATDDLIDLLAKFKRTHQQNTTAQQLFTEHPDFIVSQAAIFLLAGFETSSSLIAFTLYELAKEPTIQLRLRSELSKSFATAVRNQLSYEVLNTLPYLNMVVSEALRLYPAAAFVNRECTPAGYEEGFSLKPFADFVVPSGMPAYISILGLHRDPKYWPDPEQFKPERFSPEAIRTIRPMTYLPFGAGPHGCIGTRLGLLQVKLGLAQILRSHRVQTCGQTVPSIKFDPTSFMLQAKGGIYLEFVNDASRS